MSVTNIYHKTRDLTHKMNFSAYGETTWSFTQEGDGEIYDVEMTNVASYTIEGSAVTLPYAVVSGQPYAVAIVKTTAGQPASITFKTRRVIEKITSQNVPDFGAYAGDYLFVLKNNNVVEKHDKLKFYSTFYSGGGIWAESSLLGSVTLPTLSGGNFEAIYFCGDRGVLALASGKDGNSALLSVCQINPDTLSITDLDGLSNTYSNIGFTGLTANIGNIGYDFVNDILIFGASNNNFVLNLASKTAYTRFTGSPLFNLVGNNSIPKLSSFSPISQTFALSGDLKEPLGYAINYKVSYIRGCAFNYSDLNTYLCDNGNRLLGFNSLGQQVVNRGLAGNYNYQNTKYIEGSLLVVFNTSGNRYVTFSDSSTHAVINYSTIEGYETNMYMRDIAVCGSDIVVFSNNIPTSVRLFVFDPQSKAYIGYKDLDAPINSICSDKYV